MLSETVDEWTEKWREEGFEEGCVLGFDKGREEGYQEGRTLIETTSVVSNGSRGRSSKFVCGEFH